MKGESRMKVFVDKKSIEGSIKYFEINNIDKK